MDTTNIKNKKPLVINLIGGPCCGKSTAASGLFHALKKLQLNVEYSTEWVKNKVYEESYHCVDDQIYIFAKQHHKLFVMQDKVDIIVTDCSLLNSLVYGTRKKNFDGLVLEQFNEFNNFNVFLRRSQKYVTDGRMEDEAKAIELDEKYKKVMRDNNIPFIELDNVDACDFIVQYLLKNNLI